MKKILIISIIFFLERNTKSSAQTWYPLTGGDVNGSVHSMIYFDGYLWVGGTFDHTGLIMNEHIARYNGYSWVLTPTIDGTPIGFCIFNNELYALGGFTDNGNLYGMMKWTGSGWVALCQLDHGYIRTATVYNGELIVGGRFFSIDGIALNYIAKYDGATWSTFNSGITTVNGGFGEADIRSLFVSNGSLYIGGSFDKICGFIANCGARWNGISFSSLNISGTNYISSFIKYNGSVYACGPFVSGGPVNSQAILRVDTTVLSGWSALNSGVAMSALTMAVFQNHLYVAGQVTFSFAGSALVGNCGYWDGASFYSDNLGINIVPSRTILLLYYDSINNVFYSVGDFNTQGGDNASYIARYGPGSPLSIDDFDFKVQICGEEKENACLSWKDYSVNNSNPSSSDELEYFEIEHSFDCKNFKLIAKENVVLGKVYYDFIHKNISDKINYYRLVSVNKNGIRKIYSTISVAGKSDKCGTKEYLFIDVFNILGQKKRFSHLDFEMNYLDYLDNSLYFFIKYDNFNNAICRGKFVVLR